MTGWTRWTTGPRADRWDARFRQALARGADPHLSHEDERLLGPLALMALATERLPALALLTPALVLCDDIDEAVIVGAQRLAAAVVRFTVRALELHARDAGYLPGEWIAAGVARAELPVEAADDHRALFVDHVDADAGSLAAAIVATETDLMAVPEHLSGALGAGLAVYAGVIGASA